MKCLLCRRDYHRSFFNVTVVISATIQRNNLSKLLLAI